MKDITKKEFEELVNKECGFEESVHGSNPQRKATKRNYGTYIRSADKEMFDISYKRYITTGRLRVSLWDEE